jgi:hypothetical protein
MWKSIAVLTYCSVKSNAVQQWATEQHVMSSSMGLLMGEIKDCYVKLG